MKSYQSKFLTFVVILILSFAVQADQQTANPSSCLISKAQGSGYPVILMPGFTSDERVWEEVATALASEYQVHLLAIAGFGQNPACEHSSAIFQQIRQDIPAYINQQGLVKPVFIGHSMGGLMAFNLAVERQALFGGAVSVDGLPFIGVIFTRTQSVKVADLEPQATRFKQLYEASSPSQRESMAKQGLYVQTNRVDKHPKILAMAKNSDGKTAASAIYSVMTTDLRPDMELIQHPFLLIGASGGFNQPQQHENMQALYQATLGENKHVNLVMNQSGRHFLMWDQTSWLVDTLKKFIEGVR